MINVIARKELLRIGRTSRRSHVRVRPNHWSGPLTTVDNYEQSESCKTKALSILLDHATILWVRQRPEASCCKPSEQLHGV